MPPLGINSIVPGPCDVLVGRGKLYNEHLGNVRYRKLVADNKERYDNASTFEKTALSMIMVKIVKEASGRFLKYDGEGWHEIEDSQARTKVANCFRKTQRGAQQISLQERCMSPYLN